MKLKFRTPTTAGILMLLLGLTGCGDDDPRSSVSGTVTLNGERLTGGEIVFVPVNPRLASESARIDDGRYTMRVAPGEKQVVIRAERDHPTAQMPGPDPGTMIPLREQFIPKRYNDNTELTAEVVQGANKFDFELEAE
ncbi:MAG: hypothetical protein WDZ51_14415 [Pirellulaceae bacterium]